MYRTSAILVVGNRCPSSTKNPGDPTHSERGDGSAEALASLEVLGQSILERVAIRLLNCGIGKVHVIASETGFLHKRRDAQVETAETLNGRLLAAGRVLEECARHGLEAVLLAELGAYVEFDATAAFRFHRETQQVATPLDDRQGSLGWWMIDPARWLSNRNSGGALGSDELPVAPTPYLVEGYVNRLSSPHDLRQLVVDAFAGRCAIAPQGHEIRPGVWIDSGARVDKTARLVAPSYIGRHTQVDSGTVITRFSNLECNCVVGEDTVLHDASVLPHTTIGRGLDVCSAVVNGSEYFDLARNVTVKIQDPRLIAGALPAKAPTRHLPEVGQVPRHKAQPEMEYSYLSRAAGRLLEVFKGEV